MYTNTLDLTLWLRLRYGRKSVQGRTRHQGSLNGCVGKLAHSGRKTRAPGGGLCVYKIKINMNMKKIILLAILLTPVFAGASIDVNLKYGATGAEVVELQEFLIDKGFLNYNATGNFFSLTNSAVVKYQGSVGLPTTGFVGPMTREKINAELATKTNSANQQEVAETGSVSTASKMDQITQMLNQIKVLQELIAKQNQTQQSTLASIQQIQQNTTPVFACVSDWQCSNWNTCTNFQQARTCEDLNSCDISTNKPPVVQSCYVSTPQPTESPSLVITLINKSLSTSGFMGDVLYGTSTLIANFGVKIKAVGGDIILGKQGSTMPIFSSDSFKVYMNGNEVDTSSNNDKRAGGYIIPSECTAYAANMPNNCILGQGKEITISVGFSMQGRNKDGSPLPSGSYSVGMGSVFYGVDGNSKSVTSMSGLADWKTNSTAFP